MFKSNHFLLQATLVLSAVMVNSNVAIAATELNRVHVLAKDNPAKYKKQVASAVSELKHELKEGGFINAK